MYSKYVNKHSFINTTTKLKCFSVKINTAPVRSFMLILFFSLILFNKNIFYSKKFYTNNFVISYKFLFFLNSKFLKKIFFNFILLSVYFTNIVNIIPFFLVYVFIWFFFLKNNFLYIRLNASSNDVLKNSKVLKKFNFKILLNFSIIILTLLFLTIFFLKDEVKNFWWNHLYLNNTTCNILCFIILFSVIVHVLVFNIDIKSNVNNIDYYFSILNLSVTIPILFYSNSLYNFIFLLEMISILIFYKFSVSKFWFKTQSDVFDKKNVLERSVSRSYLNVLFYQYWVNFFSSTIIIISIINIIFIYGSTDWVFVNFLTKINTNVLYINYFEYNFILWVSIFIGFFLKIGLSPIHLFKIEVYKGIPFISVFFYTTFYFLSYFLFLSLLMYQYLCGLKMFWWLFSVVFILIGMLYIISLLFDTNFTKAFFAYSTVANSMSFLCLLIASV